MSGVIHIRWLSTLPESQSDCDTTKYESVRIYESSLSLFVHFVHICNFVVAYEKTLSHPLLNSREASALAFRFGRCNLDHHRRGDRLCYRRAFHAAVGSPVHP